MNEKPNSTIYMRLLLLFLMGTVLCAAQTPFSCDDANFYQVISGALRSYDPVTGLYSEPLHTHSPYNGGGYNSVDNYIYALRKSDTHLLRIGTDYIRDLGEVANNQITTFEYGYAADIDHLGNLWVFQNNIDKQTFHKIQFVQDYDGSESPVFEVIQADNPSPKGCADIVFINGHLYGGGSKSGDLYKWDLTNPSQPVFSSRSVSGLPDNVAFGACYTDSSNRLYLSSNKGGLYLILDYESETPHAILLNNTEITNQNDGFKCALGVSPVDADADGVLDNMDADTDGDGIPNLIESNGIDPFADDDGDGVFNYLDSDFGTSCNGGIATIFDTDQDGIPNVFDLDTDNDGILDIKEAGLDQLDSDNDGRFTPLDSSYQDTDLDGVADIINQSNYSINDSDNDLIYDFLDIDSDNDGIIDLIEGQSPNNFQKLSGNDDNRNGIDDFFDPSFSGIPQGYENTDEVDLPNYLDEDSDNDGILDRVVAYDYNGDLIADIEPKSLDRDQDGLDDSYDLKDLVFDASNDHQNPTDFPWQGLNFMWKYLGGFDGQGLPDYFATNTSIESAVFARTLEVLPEGESVSNRNPAFLYSGYDTEIVIDKPTTIEVTFMSAKTVRTHALAYYVYNENEEEIIKPSPEEITIIYPNFSEDVLSVGQTVSLGSFKQGTVIGWMLLVDGWQEQGLTEGDYQLYSTASFNPECDETYRNHIVQLADTESEKVIVNFEADRRDLAGESNHDFNDIQFAVTASDYTAIRTDNMFILEEESNVTSAKFAGLESNGSLAQKIGRRTYKNNISGKQLDKKSNQKSFAKNGRKFSNNLLSTYIPETGVLGIEEALISTPEDLIGITNATNVFSVDYYREENRIAAILATESTGGVYEHSKNICDRLNGSILLDSRVLSLKGYDLIMTKIRREGGELEYLIHFSIHVDDEINAVYSLWNTDLYPEGDYMNFQTWGNSLKQVTYLANTILTKLEQERTLLRVYMKNHIPSLFAKKGVYKDGKIILEIINKSGLKEFLFFGNKKETESASVEEIQKKVPLSGSYYEEVTIDIGHLFDIGFNIRQPDVYNEDTMYLADGPWGLDYVPEGVTITNFEIEQNPINEIRQNYYDIERNPKVKGSVKFVVNLFRNVKGGNGVVDVSDYNALQLNLVADHDVEIILVDSQLIDWKDRFRYKVPKKEGKQIYNIPFSKFKNTVGKTAKNISEVRNVVFSIEGDNKVFEPFILEVDQLAFTKELLAERDFDEEFLVNFPNPFSGSTTLLVPQAHQNYELFVYDMLGCIVDKKVMKSTHTPLELTYTNESLDRGVYKYLLIADGHKEYKGSFLVF